MLTRHSSWSSLQEDLFLPADHLIASTFKIYTSLESYITKEIEDLKLKFSTYVNVNSLTAQLCTFRVVLKEVELKCFQDHSNVVTKLERLEKQLIIHANPATSAIKSWHNSHMQQARFNDLPILYSQHTKRDWKDCVQFLN